MIPCFCSGGVQSTAHYFYQYDKQKYARGKDIMAYLCQNSNETILIPALLKGFEPPAIKGLPVSNVIRFLWQLQANGAASRDDEDSRNSIITMLLPGSGYFANDQTRSGYTPTSDIAALVRILGPWYH